ncbi:glutamine--fructose-6-phosphate transaminase (isomerizing) [Inquilinus limosus]|uniref:Glutamine--fructose-6-phosphate aminotransferase [isomerizing] n=1 Tax=Inquilinus limosus TaxID=171674 RepID=A0A211ZTF5_9PROT|nr:glutamine--fructose-6-phosphate transaminase (isomerizing) [Inquilinus limosus]OWJ68545.1 glutamine--fructose-6-phosphate transaminase (isomerizing) [Inquilinus limosus]
MCGIVGIVGTRPVASRLVEALKRLEYRGYDSAGIATLVGGRIERRRAEGKLVNLERRLGESPVDGTIGIGHTRWATHGRPSETNAHPHATDRVAIVHNGIIENFRELRRELGIGHTRWATHGRPSETNAHPHATDRVAIVHNGIIENFRELRRELEGLGHVFATETDSEIVAHLVSHYLDQQLSPREASAAALKRLEGAFALAFLFTGEEDLLVVARRGSPLAIGFGDGEMYVGSDALAIGSWTDRICYLDEGDWAVIARSGVEIYDAEDRSVERPVKPIAQTGALIGKGDFRHYMLKEIYEQPAVVGDTLRTMLDPATRAIVPPPLPFDFADVPRATIVACGTAFYSGMVAKYWFETVARLPVEIDIASEFRYREAPLPKGGLAIFVSQSGETADTLAALRYARSQGQRILSIVNVPDSSIARESDAVIQTLAGPEIGVASTKAFTTQLTVLACLAVAAARARGAIDAKREAELSTALTEVPGRLADVLNHDATIRDLSHQVALARDVLYLGRGLSYPLALEGALKLKEISYIHAEGYAAGEMKHGPIALIDDKVPVIVLAPRDAVFDKTVSNVQEVMARGGKVIFFSDTDVDQPRNLAKSVTVE